MRWINMRRMTLIIVGSSVWLLALAVASAGSQTPPPRVQEPKPGARAQGDPAREPGDFSVAQVQQMFDAMTLMQAEQALKLTDAQYPNFVSRLRALQQQRRRFLQERRQLIQQLAKLTAPRVDPIDDAQVKDRLKALADLDARGATEQRAAYDALDETLTARQQARFRVLEEQIERRKFDLLARARRAAADAAAPNRGAIK
jgi:hypothetical protein